MRLVRSIDELLELARLDAGSIRLSIEPVDLVATAREVWESALPAARAQGIELLLEAPAATQGVLGDAFRLDSVLTNLVGNALKYTPAGGHVALRVQETTDFVTVEVSDDGPGIAPADLPLIFDRFYQIEPQGGCRRGGVGLGLPLARDLVELHGGRLDVSSRLQQGTTFRVWLPKGEGHVPLQAIERRRAAPAGRGRRDRFEEEAPAGPVAGVAQLRPDGSGGRVLIVEDDGEMRAFLAKLLATRYQVLEAADAAEGLLRARAERPDLVLSDVMMPGRSGVELCRDVKSDPHIGHTPVVLLTAQASADAMLQGLGAGADEYVAKPFHPAVLLARIEGQLQLRRLSLQLVAQEKLAALGTLAAGVAHEVRNPLNALLNAARLLRARTADPATADQLLGVVQEGALRIDAVVSALDGQVRPADAGGGRASVGQAVESTLTLLSYRMEGVTVERAIASDRAVRVPPAVLNQALVNLLDNALRAGARRISVRVEDAGARVRLLVSDDGPGVPREVAARIFDPFFTLRPPGQGMGLGLYLSRKSIVEHGGDLTLLPGVLSGASFELLLPADDGPGSERQEAR
jgi:signal transduction histidine kinase